MDKNFKPDTSWMAQKYDEMNGMLFNGKLGTCDFAIFTKGKGSQGGVLGWFKMDGTNLKVERRYRRIYKLHFDGHMEYVNRENFCQICKPKIELNGNYTGTENAFLATLVHEMCHYYTYMYGWAPAQAHGREFREIGYVVSSRSNGMFTIQRLASAEQMSELELGDDMKAKKEKRLENKKSKINAIFIFKRNGGLLLSTTSNHSVIEDLIRCEKRQPDTEKVIMSNDTDLIEYLFSLGYKKDFRSLRCWDVAHDNGIVDMANGNYNYRVLYQKNETLEERQKRFLEILEDVEENMENNSETMDITPDMNLGLFAIN